MKWNDLEKELDQQYLDLEFQDLSPSDQTQDATFEAVEELLQKRQSRYKKKSKIPSLAPIRLFPRLPLAAGAGLAAVAAVVLTIWSTPDAVITEADLPPIIKFNIEAGQFEETWHRERAAYQQEVEHARSKIYGDQ